MVFIRYLGEWLSHVKNILCINGFGKVRIDQGVSNQNRFLRAFEERCHDIYAHQCLSEIHDSNMYKEVKDTLRLKSIKLSD